MPGSNGCFCTGCTGRIILETDYDDNGNVIKVVFYGKLGKIAYKQEFLPCEKKKLIKINNDGSFREEVCPDE